MEILQVVSDAQGIMTNFSRFQSPMGYLWFIKPEVVEAINE